MPTLKHQIVDIIFIVTSILGLEVWLPRKKGSKKVLVLTARRGHDIKTQTRGTEFLISRQLS